MKIYILSEVREDHPSLIRGERVYNDYVSRRSMEDFCTALNKIGYDCTFFGGMQALLSAYLDRIDTSDALFINYNYGLPAAYKRTQCPTLLELMNANYSGADPFASLLVNDKEYSKKVIREAGILTPPGFLVTSATEILEKLTSSKIPLPIVVKPNSEGSSLGITEDSLCTSYQAAASVACNLLSQYQELVVEQYIPGYECTVWMIGNAEKFRLIAPLLISQNGNYYFKNKIFTLQDKANHAREYELPEKILGEDLVIEIKNLAQKIFIELGMRDYARIDFRIAKDGIYFIEANALPIFSKTSEIGKITQLYNLTYEEICRYVVDSALDRLMAKAN